MTVPYAKRFAGGFFDLPSQTTQIDSAFLNAVEAALIQLCALAPSGNQVPIWNSGNTRFEPGQIADAQVAAAAAIAISKLASYPADATKVLKGDGSWGQIVDAMVASGAALAISKLAGYPADATKFLRGDATWAAPPAYSLISHTEFTSPMNITATVEGSAQTIVTAPAFTFDGVSKYDFEFFAPSLQATGVALRAVLFEDGSAIGWLGEIYGAAGTANAPARLLRSKIPTNASHTYSVRGFNSGSSTLTVQAGAGGAGNFMPGYLRITKAPS